LLSETPIKAENNNPMELFKKISIIIPVYNEKNTAETLINKVLGANTLGLEKEIIVVDDASTDGTQEVLKTFSPVQNIKLMLQPKNQGKGAAIRKGFETVTGDLVIIQDADLEYDPNEYPKLIEYILNGKADVVYGSRFHSGPRRVLLFWHFIGNSFLTFLSNAFNDLNLTDMETCYKAFTRKVLNQIKIRSNRFGFEPEFTAKVAKNKFKIYEVPISYDGRSYAEGKKITWKDGIKALFSIIWFRFFD
jgi:glycosyltransferase involved in cell wall biosynthesis